MIGIKVSQILQGHFLGFHLGILVLKFSNEPIYLSSKRTRSQMICLKYPIELELLQTVFTLGI